jgi:hypothetical protein
MALKGLLCSVNVELPQHWSVLRAIHTHNSPKNYIHLLGGLCYPYVAPVRSARPHVGHWGGISSGGGHGRLWLCLSMLAIGG